jgi:ATP-dependent helicase/nuclease subunit A
MRRDAATQVQIDAARPDRSTWLSANAGSGKTRVLTDRVARLLLGGIDPQHILCLTYTKAAASEMQNRLLGRLGKWAMLTDAALIKELTTLGADGQITPDILRDARRLFARAIETPGGLKIQTIHSFCSGLLRRFPLESGVSPQFREMEQRTSDLLRSEIVEDIANGPKADLLYTVARHYSGETFEKLTAEIVRHQVLFETPPDDDALARLFGQNPGFSPEQLITQTFQGNERAILDHLIPALSSSGPNDQKACAKLKRITGFDQSALPFLEDVFLTGKSAKSPFSAKIGGFPTKACQKTIAEIMPQLEQWMLRVEATREPRLTLDAMQKTRALHAFAQVFLPAYTHAKQLRGLLDFDDLILRARALLTNPDVAAWVLFRLDGGIDHILVDEAQDTNPVQWQVIERLAQEFTSGQGARADTLRTIFVVGDKKQSIYSFQGADPREFDRMKDDFTARLKATDTPLQDMSMGFSFRSSQAILTAVDHTFENSEPSGFTPDQPHIAFKSALPGRVDLWPVIPKPDKEEKPEWHMPVDVKAPNDPAILLARQVAAHIHHLIDTKHPIPASEAQNGAHPSHPAQPGDFLILVQRRSPLFHEIIRECKTLNLPVAGADRLKVGAELAVRDLEAMLSFLATPDDSYSLAVALKSPLLGWPERDLYDLAEGRAQKFLWAELRDRADEFPATMTLLNDLRDKADYLRPYDLIERILTRHHGRRNMLARLGSEAEDGIDALLSQALSFEQNAVDSLTGFLVWMQADELEIKRQMDSAGNRIRVMTVHGAKGLESPVVILPDTGKRDIKINAQLVTADDTVLWRTNADTSPGKITAITERMKAAEKAERDRLLYVAMTRAEKWLIVAAAGDLGTSGETWYDKVKEGMTRAGAAPHEFTNGEGLRLTQGDWAENTASTANPSDPLETTLPPYFATHPPAASPAPATLSPSDLGGAKALAGEPGLDEDAALRRGRQIHTLLEFLPEIAPDQWPAMAARLLTIGENAASGPELSGLLAEASKVLTTPALKPLFGSALTEVPITAPSKTLENHRIHGSIDRLIIGEGHILAVDFKTNAVVPERASDCPEGLLRQMGAYGEALQLIWPDHRIEVAILWTRTASLMTLPHDLVSLALQNTPIP